LSVVDSPEPDELDVGDVIVIDVIHGDADIEHDEAEQLDEDGELGQPVSKLPELRRPCRGFNSRVLCPACDAEIGDTLGAPIVPTDRLHGSARARADGVFHELRDRKSGECFEREQVRLLVARGPYDRDLDERGRA